MDQVSDIESLDKLLRHIRLVQEGCNIIGRKLIQHGEINFGRQLIANGHVHDSSKFYGIEWECLCCTEPNKLDQLQLAAIRHHQAVNPHHPEYWGNIDLMPEIYLAEMVCDVYARSAELGTDLRDWLKNTAQKKYDISPSGKTWKLIKKYTDLLLNPQLTPITKETKPNKEKEDAKA